MLFEVLCILVLFCITCFVGKRFIVDVRKTRRSMRLKEVIEIGREDKRHFSKRLWGVVGANNHADHIKNAAEIWDIQNDAVVDVDTYDLIRKTSKLGSKALDMAIAVFEVVVDRINTLRRIMKPVTKIVGSWLNRLIKSKPFIAFVNAMRKYIYNNGGMNNDEKKSSTN